MDLSRRSPWFWVGLAVATLATFAFVCALALITLLAASHLRQTNIAAATPVIDQSGGAPAQSPPASSSQKATATPRLSGSWPTDTVPMPAEADLGTLVGSPEVFSVISDQDFKDVLAFYQQEMVTQGWSKVDYGTRITDGEAELHYRKDQQDVTLILARIPFVGTLVEIHLQPA